MPADQLAYEARVRLRQAGVAMLGALLLIAAAAAQLTGPQAKVSELTVQLIYVDKRFPLDVISGALEALGLLGLIWSLSFLFDIARARNPDVNNVQRIAAIAGGLVAAVGGVVYAAVVASKAHQFVHSGAQTYQQANHLTHGAALPALQTLDIAAQFALSLGLVFIALNAMRVGLLTRFMGYFGIVVAAAGVLLIGSPPAVALQVCWLLALGVIFSGRWPGGDPPAWRTGHAEPWPSTQELREQRIRAAGAGGRGKAAPRPDKPDREPVAAPARGVAAAEEGAAAGRTRATTPKRKRKRRR